jgi:hypothetical protein
MKSQRFRFARMVIGAALIAVAITATAGPKSGGGNQGSQQSSSGPSGAGGNNSASSSGSFFETQMLAYGAINQIAYAIARRVCTSKPNSTVIVFDQISFQNLQAWQAFQASADALTAAYQTLTSQANGTPPTAGNPNPSSSTLSTQGPGPAATPKGFFAGADVSGLISAIAASTTNSASSFTVPDSAMATAILHQMGRVTACTTVTRTYYPLFGNSANLTDPTNYINAVLVRLNNARYTFLQILTANTPTNATTSPLWLAADHLNTDYDQLLNTLSASVAQNQTPAAATLGPNPGITSIVQGAQIASALKATNTYVLYANVISAGGTQRDRKNLFTMIFTGDLITYSGGAVVNYALTESATDKLVDADVLRYRSGFTRLHDVHESTQLESVDSADNIVTLCRSEVRAGWPGGAATSAPCQEWPAK